MTGVLCSFICLPLTSVVSFKPFCHRSLPPSSEQELARSAKKYFSTRKLSSLALPACILSSPSTWLPSSQWPGGRGIVQKSLGLPTNLLLSSKSPWNSGSLERVVRSSLLFLLTEYTEDLNHKWVGRSLIMQPSFWEGTFLQFCLWCLDLGKDFGSQKVDIQQCNGNLERPVSRIRTWRLINPSTIWTFQRTFRPKQFFLRANFPGYKPNKT